VSQVTRLDQILCAKTAALAGTALAQALIGPKRVAETSDHPR